MNTIFRQCTYDDIIELRNFSHKTYFETFAAMNTPENMAAYLHKAFNLEKLHAELLNEASSFYFLYSDNALAGYLKLNEAQAQTEFQDAASLEIERIYVDKRFQGKGFGQHLIDYAIQMAGRKHKEYVWLGVWEQNEKAIRFYKKNGFYKIGSHSFFMGDDE